MHLYKKTNNWSILVHVKNCTQCKGFQIDYWSTTHLSLTDKSSIHISSSKYNFFSDNAWLKYLIFLKLTFQVLVLCLQIDEHFPETKGQQSKHQPWKHFMWPFYIINSVVKPNFLVMPSTDAAPQFLYKLTPFVH